MGSSFLTAIDIALTLYCVSQFLKYIIQFGLPNHPSRFTLYLVTLCATSFFALDLMADLSLISPFDFMRWRSFPLIAGSLGLLLQVITTVGQFGMIQQKIISRIPLIGALLVFAIFPNHADVFFTLTILATVLFLTVSLGKARYQKRMLLKMALFLGFVALGSLINTYPVYLVSKLFLFPALFYFFVFQQSYGVSALIEQHLDAGVTE